jgi:hypothetical protein
MGKHSQAGTLGNFIGTWIYPGFQRKLPRSTMGDDMQDLEFLQLSQRNLDWELVLEELLTDESSSLSEDTPPNIPPPAPNNSFSSTLSDRLFYGSPFHLVTFMLLLIRYSE